MRSLKIFLVFSKYFLVFKFTSNRNKNFGERFKMVCEKLGVTFIKIGQILSMRYDLLSEESCHSLQSLLDNVNPIQLDNIFFIIQEEYGKPHEMVFKKFFEEPLGSASISQVHKAELFDGRIVAVKIKRPLVDEFFVRDIKIMKKLVRFAMIFSGTLRNFQVSELVKFFENWILQDLDFELEAKNMKKIKEQYSFGDGKEFSEDLGKGVFISPIEKLCTKNIIVMDFVDGIPMSNKDKILNNPEYNIEKSIKTYVIAAMRNWFRDDIESYLFQADPHLSNILALPHGDAANIDCGLISELSKKEAEMCRNLIIAVYMKDIKSTVKMAIDMTGVNYEKFKDIIQPDLEIYLKKTDSEGFGFWFLEFTKILVKHNIKFPLYLTTFGRTNLILDGLTKTYMPEQTTLDILGKELRQQAIKHTIKSIVDTDWFKIAYTITEKTKQAPEIINDLINNPFQFISELSNAIQGRV